MRKFIVISIVLLMLAGFAITSSAMEVELVVGRKHIPVGELLVEVVGVNLVVTYTMDLVDPGEEGWELLETHLYVGVELPEKSAPGQFPYGPESDYATADGFTIPLSVLPASDSYFIAAQAEIGMVVDGEPFPDSEEQIEETAWAWTEEDLSIPPGKNWATYFEFEVVVE
jgi:hypothetical protein